MAAVRVACEDEVNAEVREHDAFGWVMGECQHKRLAGSVGGLTGGCADRKTVLGKRTAREHEAGRWAEGGLVEPMNAGDASGLLAEASGIVITEDPEGPETGPPGTGKLPEDSKSVVVALGPVGVIAGEGDEIDRGCGEVFCELLPDPGGCPPTAEVQISEMEDLQPVEVVGNRGMSDFEDLDQSPSVDGGA